MKKFFLMVAVVLAFVMIFVFTAKTSARAAEVSDLLNPERDYLIIVNDDNPYEFGGEYDQKLQEDLVETFGVAWSDEAQDYVVVPKLLERATSEAFSRLKEDLEELWEMEIGLFSGYRDYDDQQAVYDYYGHLEGWAETNKVSLPGFSEHHTGLLVNVVIKYNEDSTNRGDWIWYTETAERQERLPYFKLLHWALPDYGFIDRYPKGKEEITGVPCEPYEIRFVGSPEVAHAIADNGLTLEEYVAQNK